MSYFCLNKKLNIVVLKTFNILKDKRVLKSTSACRIFNGKEASNRELKLLKKDIDKWTSQGNRPPYLKVILVGNDPASISYIRIKTKAAKFAGIKCDLIRMNKSVCQNDLLSEIKKLNVDPDVDGLPLPNHLNERIVSDCISAEKDVDGFTESNIGRLCLNNSKFIPCTAMAVYYIIRHFGIETEGKHAVICGRSKHVGLPIALMLHSSNKIGTMKGLNMTTTLCHRHTPLEQLKSLTRTADVIVSAAGVPHLIKSDMVKNGATVIDVGITRVKDLEMKKDIFIGDVDFESVKEKAKCITPVPGGVGPVTVAMLMRNTLQAAKNNKNKNKGA